MNSKNQNKLNFTIPVIAASFIGPSLMPDRDALWEEFEARSTAEAKFAAALDRLQPLLNNYRTRGGLWRKHGIKSSQVYARNRIIEEGSPRLWEYADCIIKEGIAKGWLSE